MRFPERRNARQVQAFLDLSDYFRKFISKYNCAAVIEFIKN